MSSLTKLDAVFEIGTQLSYWVAKAFLANVLLSLSFWVISNRPKTSMLQGGFFRDSLCGPGRGHVGPGFRLDFTQPFSAGLSVVTCKLGPLFIKLLRSLLCETLVP